MQQEKETVSQESHVFTRRQLASMTLPFILDSLSIMLISMLITALISSAGESSVAAVNLVSPIFTLIVCLMNGISAGGTVEIAQSYGSRDMERMNLAAGHILWMTFLSGTALSLVLILFPRPILTALYPQAEPEVLEKAVTYMVQGSFSLILFTIYTGIFCILRGLGASGKCLCLTIVINVAYLLFSILFLNVWKLDILGSALAQIAARALGSGCALVFLLHPGKLPIHITRKNLFACRRDVAASILRVSVPFGLEQIFLYGGNIVIATMTVPLGTFAISANAIASSLQGVITAAGWAIHRPGGLPGCPALWLWLHCPGSWAAVPGGRHLLSAAAHYAAKPLHYHSRHAGDGAGAAAPSACSHAAVLACLQHRPLCAAGRSRHCLPLGAVPAVHVGRAHWLWLCAVLPAGAGH